MRIMLSICRTAMGTPPVRAEAARSSEYKVAIYKIVYINLLCKITVKD